MSKEKNKITFEETSLIKHMIPRMEHNFFSMLGISEGKRDVGNVVERIKLFDNILENKWNSLSLYERSKFIPLQEMKDKITEIKKVFDYNEIANICNSAKVEAYESAINEGVNHKDAVERVKAMPTSDLKISGSKEKPKTFNSLPNIDILKPSVPESKSPPLPGFLMYQEFTQKLLERNLKSRKDQRKIDDMAADAAFAAKEAAAPPAKKEPLAPPTDGVMSELQAAVGRRAEKMRRNAEKAVPVQSASPLKPTPPPSPKLLGNGKGVKGLS